MESKILKFFTLEKVALFASLVSVFVLIDDIYTIGNLTTQYQYFRPHPICITTSVAFALSITSLFRVLLSRPVKWRSKRFVYSLVAIILAVIPLTNLLGIAFHIYNSY